MYFAKIKRPYLRAYLDSMPEKYKGVHQKKVDIVRNKDGSVTGSTSAGYTPQQLKKLDRDTQSYFLTSNEQCKVVRDQLKQLGFDGSVTIANGDCGPNAVLQQIAHPEEYRAIDLRRQVAWHMAKYPHLFAALAPLDYENDERLESYILNMFDGTIWADSCFFSVIAHMFNVRVTLVGPEFREPIKCHHNSQYSDMVIICNGGFEDVGEMANTHFTAGSKY